MTNEPKTKIPGIKYNELGIKKSKEIATEYVRTILYWTVLGLGISGFSTHYIDKHYLKFKARPSKRKSLKYGIFFTLFAGCLYRGNYFADLKFKIGQRELQSNEFYFQDAEIN